MKILIILSALLLIPIVMKFQERTFLETSVPRTEQAILAVLAEHGVAEPSVTVDYLDVSVAGLVSAEAEARVIGEEVDAIRGVRLVSNQLISPGWFEIKREGESLDASGLVAPHWVDELLKGQKEVDARGLEASSKVQMVGKSVVSWGLMIDSFYEGDGERTFSLRDGRVTLSGETTPEKAREWLSEASSLVPGTPVTSNFEVFPSVYHFNSRIPLSPLEGEPLRSLSRTLADSLISFEPVSTEPTTAARGKIQELAEILLETDQTVRFVLGAHPDAGGEALAARRAQQVKSSLEQAGVPSSRLEVVAFEMTEDGSGFSGQVELLIL
ncbi:BON domain-containing protein [Roseibacillus persicicus]|uniref:BON domain-containing protein n=1 Tax=Roseibacillus persicicus TaxID=454148 RepID=UPI00280F448E|nr:BON domain-containing protein [Roseibacillus persicicus]MDQ8191635.1 hypothetical protein [Roseibacillus persicicus]